MTPAFACVILNIPLANPTVPTTGQRGDRAKITAHGAVGVYDITLDEPVSDFECCEIATPRGAADATITVDHVSDTVKRIRTNIAGVASNLVSFSVAFFRLPAGHQ